MTTSEKMPSFFLDVIIVFVVLVLIEGKQKERDV